MGVLIIHYFVIKSDYVKLNDFFVASLIKFLSLFLHGTKIYQDNIHAHGLNN
jgi:cytosine/uracil/thiamine/allantoin permease